MKDKKTPPKKLSKAEVAKQLEDDAKKAAAVAEKESGLPAVLNVKVKTTGEEFEVSRDYYLRNKGSVEIVD